MAKEVPLNSYLAAILLKYGIEAEPEASQTDGSTIDVKCVVGDKTVAIEAEHGYSNTKMKEAIRDANNKLARNVCDVAIAIVYPTECNSLKALESSEVRAHVRTQSFKQDRRELNRQAQNAQWRTIKTADFANYVRQAPNELGSPDALAKLADIAINSAADKFNQLYVESIMAQMGEAAIGTNITGLMTDMLTALMFHTKLDTIRHKSKPTLDARANPPVDFNDEWPPPTVQECINSDQIAKMLHNAHDLWLAVDYKQILEWSCAIINALPATPASNNALKILAQAAIDIQRTAGSQHHDLVGITFCQSVESAKSDGSMYTTIPAATILAHMLFNDIDIDWSDFDQVTGLRIVDFACGTGTLLIAAANYILEHEQTNRSEEVAEALLEQMLYGFDINNRAIFQTATGIGMIAPNVAFRKMHLYSLMLGIDSNDEQPKLGSLELLEGLNQYSFNPRPPTGTRIDTEPAPIETETFNIAIMNPPFTTNSKRHHHLPKNIKQALNNREKQLYKGTNIPHTGNIAGFLVLADKYLDNNNGRLAFVAPTAISTAKSALGIRKDLAKTFHIKYLIVSYDPRRIYQSGNTSIGEMLVVMERKQPHEQRPTIAVKLTTNPSSASDAAACAYSIINGDATTHEWGFVDYIDRSSILCGDWSALQFANNDLYKIASESLWHKTLQNQFEIRTIGRRIHEHTQKSRQSDPHATPALYDHNVNHCDRLLVTPDQYVKPKLGNTRALKYLKQPHRLKLPTRIRLTSVKNMACLTTVPTVSAAWQSGVPICVGEHSDEDAEKAVAMILNSSPGKLAMLSVRVNRVPSYPTLPIDTLQRIPMPSISKIKPEKIQQLVTTFDKLADTQRYSFPRAHECPVQLAIDETVCEVLDFDPELCRTARHLLAQEPMVTGKPYEWTPTAQHQLTNLDII